MNKNSVNPKWKQAHRALDDLEFVAGTAINAETKEPLYYAMINEIGFLRDATTPLWIKAIRKAKQKYNHLRIFLGIDSIDEHIPF